MREGVDGSGGCTSEGKGIAGTTQGGEVGVAESGRDDPKNIVHWI
jgi:hypothetical protein